MPVVCQSINQQHDIKPVKPIKQDHTIPRRNVFLRWFHQHCAYLSSCNLKFGLLSLHLFLPCSELKEKMVVCFCTNYLHRFK